MENHPKFDPLVKGSKDESLSESSPIGQVKPKHRLGVFNAFIQNQVSLRNYISRFMVSAHEIDDVSQETFLRAYKAERQTTIEQPKAFLFRIAKNIMLSQFSNKSRKMIDYVEDFEQANMHSTEKNLEDSVIAQQKLGVYCEAIASLPPKCRQVILMKKVYGMSYKEIARRMNISVSAVEKHLIKGGKRCDAIMAERYPDLITSASKPESDTNGHHLSVVGKRRNP